MPLERCHFLGDIGPNLKNFFILYLQAQGIPKMTFKFSKLLYWHSYYNFKDILR